MRRVFPKQMRGGAFQTWNNVSEACVWLARIPCFERGWSRIKYRLWCLVVVGLNIQEFYIIFTGRGSQLKAFRWRRDMIRSYYLEQWGGLIGIGETCSWDTSQEIRGDEDQFEPLNVVLMGCGDGLWWRAVGGERVETQMAKIYGTGLGLTNRNGIYQGRQVWGGK